MERGAEDWGEGRRRLNSIYERSVTSAVKDLLRDYAHQVASCILFTTSVKIKVYLPLLTF